MNTIHLCYKYRALAVYTVELPNFIMDTLGPSIMFFIERLSFLRRYWYTTGIGFNGELLCCLSEVLL